MAESTLEITSVGMPKDVYKGKIQLKEIEIKKVEKPFKQVLDEIYYEQLGVEMTEKAYAQENKRLDIKYR